jgi:hypothetical protein
VQIGLIVVLIVGVLGSAGAAVADSPPVGATALFPSPNERFGFGVLYGISNYNVLPLNAGWYQNWGHAANAPHPGSMLAAHVVRVSPEGLQLNPAEVERIAEADPGALWLIGNEPDMFAQDNVTPGQYAVQYRQAYFTIKRYDPTAQVAAGGIVQPTPLRLGWLSATWDAYQALYGRPMPADVWNIHNYILQEAPGQWGCGIPPGYYGVPGATYPFNRHDDPTIFQDHVRAMRQWMADHGQRDKPLVISEYGILFPESSGFDLTRVRNFFVNTANWMLTASDPALGYPADENHLVQRWMWYSLDDTNYNNAGNTIAGLMDPTTRQMRAMGQAFADLATPLRRPYTNLVVARVRVTPADGSPALTDQAQLVTVRAVIQNRGNSAVNRSFRVVIQDQAGNRVYEQTVNGLAARYGGDAVVQTTWQKPAGTAWRLIVLVDADNAVGESNEEDNQWTVSPMTDLDLASLTVVDAEGRIVTAQSVNALITLTAVVKNLGGLVLNGAALRFWDGEELLHQEALPTLAPGEDVEVTFEWSEAQPGFHALAADLVLPPGIGDPVEDNNRLGRDVLLAGQRVYLPSVLGAQYQSSQAAPECHNALANPGFETGTLTGWQASAFVTLANAGCYAGSYCAYLGRGWNLEDDLSQTVYVKPWANARLNFAWAVVTTETAAAPRDTLAVEIRSGTGQLLRTMETLSNQDAHPYWYTSSFDLNEFVGQTIQLHFHARNDGANVTSFFVDEVSVEVCEGN